MFKIRKVRIGMSGAFNKDRLPHGRGSRAARDGMFCVSLLNAPDIPIRGIPEIFLFQV